MLCHYPQTSEGSRGEKGRSRVSEKGSAESRVQREQRSKPIKTPGCCEYSSIVRCAFRVSSHQPSAISFEKLKFNFCAPRRCFSFYKKPPRAVFHPPLFGSRSGRRHGRRSTRSSPATGTPGRPTASRHPGAPTRQPRPKQRQLQRPRRARPRPPPRRKTRGRTGSEEACWAPPPRTQRARAASVALSPRRFARAPP